MHSTGTALISLLILLASSTPFVHAWQHNNICKAPCFQTLEHRVSRLEEEVTVLQNTPVVLPSYVATIEALNQAIDNQIFAPANIITLREEILGTTQCSAITRKRGLEDGATSVESRSMEDGEESELTKRQGGGTAFIGELRLVGFTFCPVGFLPAAGQSLLIAENTALFALLGTRYGGNGVTNFNLPDLRDQSLKCTLWCIALQGIFPTRP